MAKNGIHSKNVGYCTFVDSSCTEYIFYYTRLSLNKTFSQQCAHLKSMPDKLTV